MEGAKASSSSSSVSASVLSSAIHEARDDYGHRGGEDVDVDDDDDDARSIGTVVPHELERVEEEEEDQMARQQQQEDKERRRRRAELGRPRMPEPMGLGMNLPEDDEEPRSRARTISNLTSPMIDELTQRPLHLLHPHLNLSRKCSWIGRSPLKANGLPSAKNGSRAQVSSLPLT